MVVFRGDKNVCVERSNFLAPNLRVRFAVLMHYGGHRLIKEWQFVIVDVDNFKLRVVAVCQELCTHSATAAAFRPGRVLPTMIPTFSISFLSLLAWSSADLWFL